MNLKHSLLAVLVIIIVSACLDDSEAQSTSTITRAEFDALVAQVQALQANQPGDKVFAAEAASGAFAKAASAVGKPLGTMVGHLPSDLPLSRSQFFSLKSSTGYLYAVSNERNANGVVGIGTYAGDGATGSRFVYYGSDDCSGFPRVPGSLLSDYGASQGLVFMIGAGEFNDVIDNPAQYFYIPAGTEREDNFNYGSRWSRVGFCESGPGTLAVAYPAFQNDPAVTGVDSSPVAAPVTLAEPPPA